MCLGGGFLTQFLPRGRGDLDKPFFKSSNALGLARGGEVKGAVKALS